MLVRVKPVGGTGSCINRRTAGGWLAALWPAAAAQATEPAWLEAGRPTALAQQALALLADAPSHGLDPLDYDLPALRRRWQAPVPDAGAAAALQAALLRFLRHLHDGRRPPPNRVPRPFDAASALQAAAALGDLSQAVRSAVPARPGYQRLREALARYRTLADHPAWHRPLPTAWGAPGRALLPGQPGPGLALLAQRLVALGDLASADAQPNAGTYQGALVAAVQAFQRRHGLADDGVIGRATLAALPVPPAARVQQLVLALERLRWMPWPDAPRRIVVNLPEFTLRACVTHGGHTEVQARMKVIVGQALDTRTPLLHEELRRIDFKPHWNVPASIARRELVPRLRRDPAGWAHEGFEFVDAAGRADAVLTDAKLQAVLDGGLRIRQRPGPRNALGDIKFVLPNRQAIYLHHTPALQLFDRTRRDLSHGCIRVEQPVALAAFVLQGQPGWDEARIRAAMAAERPSSVTLVQPVPVLVVHATVRVEGDQVHFFDDLYGHDRDLARALRRSRT